MPAPEIGARRSTMAKCLVLDALGHAKPARSSYVRDVSWDEHVLPLLPPQLAITVSDESERAANEAASRGQNWREFDPAVAASSKGPDQIVVTGDGFIERLILWGRGDFSGDGSQDLLVQTLDTLTEGTYRSTRPSF